MRMNHETNVLGAAMVLIQSVIFYFIVPPLMRR